MTEVLTWEIIEILYKSEGTHKHKHTCAHTKTYTHMQTCTQSSLVSIYSSGRNLLKIELLVAEVNVSVVNINCLCKKPGL